MLAPKSWLTDFVDLNGISDEQFAREMTFAGNKVESVQKVDGETIYEFEITPNRPDTLSIIGLAREAAAVFDRPLKLSNPLKKKNFEQRPVSLTIADKKICPFFSIVEIDSVAVRPSSQLTQKRLELSGIRPVNNVVDITNYLMLETDQPIHAFDAERLKGALTLRAARPKERIVPLDHNERVLQGGEIIIEDNEKLIDLAGLMGGLNSEISQETTHVCLLIPIYDPVAIRRASKYLRLRTEASTRFEKKLDLTQTEAVAFRAVELIEKETGGKQATTIVTTRSLRNFQQPIALSIEKVSSLVGLSFTKAEIERYLEKVGIENTTKGFQPPSWRRDITIPADLVEEVTRLHGYNKLPRTLPIGKIPINTDALAPNWKRIVAERCAALGYTETYASTLIGKQIIEELGFYSPKEHLKVLHPMSEDYEYMRRTTLETLTPFLKQNLVETRSFVNFQGINIFELGTVFIPSTKPSELPVQPLELGLVSTTNSYAEFKGHIENIGKTLGIAFEFSSGHCVEESLRVAQDNKRFGIAMTDVVSVCHAESQVGQIGLISSHVLERTDIIAYAGYLNMTAIFKSATGNFTYPQLSGYPPIIEDLTLERPAEKYLGEALSVIKHASSLIHHVDYLGEYQQFVSLRVTFQSFDRSLTQEQVSVIRKDILKKLESFGWKLKLMAGLE